MNNKKNAPVDQDRGEIETIKQEGTTMSIIAPTTPETAAKWWTCPDWCTYAGSPMHTPDSLNNGVPIITHAMTLAEVDEVLILRELTQQLTVEGLVETLSYTAYTDGEDWEVTSAERARVIAAAFTSTAERIEAEGRS